MKIILFSLLLYLGLSNLMAQEEAVVLQTPTGDIYGTLLTPERNNNLPVVLLIAGSGPTDRNGNNPLMTNNSLKMLAELLAKTESPLYGTTNAESLPAQLPVKKNQSSV